MIAIRTMTIEGKIGHDEAFKELLHGIGEAGLYQHIALNGGIIVGAFIDDSRESGKVYWTEEDIVFESDTDGWKPEELGPLMVKGKDQLYELIPGTLE